MTDRPDLALRLRELADTVPAPTVPLAEDVARGRRRLRRHRTWLAAGSAAAVAAIALAVPVAGGALSDGRGAGPAGTPGGVSQSSAPDDPPSRGAPGAPEPEPPTGAELLRTYRDVLAEHLDPAGTHLQRRPDNVQSGGGLGTKLGWRVPGQEGLGMVQVFVGRGWRSFLGADCGSGAECRRETVDGITAQVLEADGSTTVVVRRPDARVAITVDALFGNNSRVPVAGMDVPLAAIVRAAADERLAPPTPPQVEGAADSMFPGLGGTEPGPSGPPGAG